VATVGPRGTESYFDELRSHKDALPPEDAAILVAIDSAPRRNRLPLESN